MLQQLLITSILVTQPAPVTGIVARAEKAELRHSDGTVVSRVKRDTAGQVTGLQLNEMQLSREEIEELGRQPELRRLVLYRTNFDDLGLKSLVKCTHLESLNLTGTAISDDALEDIAGFKSLKYLCLGDVNVSPEAVDALKARFRSRKQEVRLGYSQRRKDRAPDRAAPPKD
jgi:hypothetical protein